jgi:hypothetical protein
MIPKLRSRTRQRRSAFRLHACALCAGVGMFACSLGHGSLEGRSSAETSPPDVREVGTGGRSSAETSPPDIREVGTGDRSSNQGIQVEEAGLIGSVQGQLLSLQIPVSSLDGSEAAGNLNVSICSVDGQSTHAQATVDYSVRGSEPLVVTAELGLPPEIERQPHLVPWNVHIDDGTTTGVRITRSLLHTLPPYEVRLEGPSQIKKNKRVTYRVQARDAISREPLSEVPVTLQLLQDGDDVVQTQEGTTSDTGVGVFDVTLDVAGDYLVSAGARAHATTATVRDALTVEEVGAKVLLTTDKPIYQPGQIIHLRSLALAPPDNEPVANATVAFEIEDGKGNKILQRSVSTDEFGIAATDFQLGQILNLGTFKIKTSLEAQVTEKTVEVSRYALPKFRVQITPDKPWYAPGEVVTAELDVGYFFGEPVADATVSVQALTLDVGETVFQQLTGRTDAEGRFQFSVTLPARLAGLPLEQGNALAALRVTATDSAGQEVQVEQLLAVASRPVELALVPEAGELTPGVENQLSLFASDPTGAPLADATLSVSLPDQDPIEVTTDEHGQASVVWTPPAGLSGSTTASVSLTDNNGASFTEQSTFDVQGGAEHVLIRTDQAVYEVGDTVSVEVISSATSPLAYVDWIHQGQAVDMRTLQVEEGTASFTATADPSLRGSSRIEAYVVDEDGNIVRTGRTIFVRDSAALSIDVATDQPSYAPGDPAQLTFSVTDESGQPTVAALGVQIVDEAVFSLIDARPGLLRTHFELEDEYAEPQYQIKGPSANLTELLFEDTASADADEAAAAQKRVAASLAALGLTSITGVQHASWPEVVAEAIELLEPFVDDETTSLITLVQGITEDEIDRLAEQGCSPDSYSCTVDGESRGYGEVLFERVAGRIRAFDFWGNVYEATPSSSGPTLLELVSQGPDERAETDDDIVIEVQYSDLDLEDVLQEYGVSTDDAGINEGLAPAPGLVGTGGASAAIDFDQPAEGDTRAGGEDEPRVRSEFPETLYVNPAVITGSDGAATIEVAMADSITEWRVLALANSRAGQLGSTTAGVTVFQDFFVDIDFPATLTRGDEIDFPIAVYNYLDTAQSVSLELELADWYTPLGDTTMTLDLEAGQVRGAAFPVRVDEVGVGTLTVRAYGTQASDAVARNVRVEPDGKAFPETFSGSLAPGQITHTASFPDNAIVGSQQLYLNVYPAYLSQVVQGMDSMLRAPHGCFEQTTSSTWPNVLVTGYMDATGQTTPEIRMRAESLISTGYQRLLTFEHPGGGFSWFGTQDPAPYLSVTAFGLMEFVDMSEVHPIDQDMVARTRQWLLDQQQADGSWQGDQSEFFSFHTSTLRNTAFVLWALATSGHTGPELARGLDYVKEQMAAESNDAYTLGIIGNATVLAAPTDPVTAQVIDELESMKTQEGDLVSWDTDGTQTNFYSYGNDASVSATAIITYALMQHGGHQATVEGALKFLTGSKDEQGNFGSTQATIWTLRTLLLAATRGTDFAVGALEVALDGSPFSTVQLTENQRDVMTTVDMSSLARVGEHDVTLTFVGTGQLSYNLVANHHVPWAEVAAEPAGPLSVTLSYDKTSLYVNEIVTTTVDVQNNTTSTQNMVLITLGIPPGFVVLEDDLAQYLQDGILSGFEQTGKQLTLYLIELAPSATQRFTYQIVATMPVKAADGGAQVFPYYEPEQKSAAAATTLEVLNSP